MITINMALDFLLNLGILHGALCELIYWFLDIYEQNCFVFLARDPHSTFKKF